MPRRKRVKCPSRSSGPELDAIVEWNLCEWLGASTALGFEYTDLEAAWECHREKLVDHWVGQLPGSRPFGSYAVGEIALPEMVATPYKSDPPYETRDGWIFNYEAYFETQFDEYTHLLKLGVIDEDEKKRAQNRFKVSDGFDHYQSLFITCAITQ